MKTTGELALDLSGAAAGSAAEPGSRRSWKWAAGLAAAGLGAVVLLAVSIPNLLKSRVASNQAASSRALAGGALGPAGEREAEPAAPLAGPMTVRTASLSFVVSDFDAARARLDQIIHQHQSSAAELTVSGYRGSPRSLNATFRVPAGELDSTLAELRNLGQVGEESQNGEEVSAQYADLQARLSNARATESRLVQILGQRTGKVSEVLEVERETARVRGEIERMEAQRKLVENQVRLAGLRIEIREEYKVPLAVADALGTRFRNAAVEGYRTLADAAVGLALLLLSWGPVTIFWAAVLISPLWLLWRRLRKRLA
jgi:uncharacterized protein DUF4349